MLLIASPQVAFRLKLLDDGLPSGALSPSLTILAFCVFSLLGWRLYEAASTQRASVLDSL